MMLTEMLRETPVDPIAFEVIRHRLHGITSEQAARLMAISGSKQVTEMSDFNVGLYLADGSVAAMGHTSLHHSVCMAQMVRAVIEDCEGDPGIGEGDMFIVNDPWKGNMHAPDIAMLAPLHVDGKLALWAGAIMHMSDIGGMAEGSLVQNATECYQEGLQLPPIKLIEGGRVRSDLMQMLVRNGRHPGTMLLDLKGLIAANNAARQGLEGLVRRYDIETLQLVMQRLIKLSEHRLRQRIAQLPDAITTGSGYMEYDDASKEVPEVHVELHKDGDGMRFDFSRSSAQVSSAINCTLGGLKAGVAAALLPTLAFGIPWNEGLFYPLEIVCPEGRICNAKRPAAVSGNIAGAVWEAQLSTLIALSRLAACSETLAGEAQASMCGRPRALAFFGTNQHGERYRGRTFDVIASGGGAYADHDGVSTQGHHGSQRALISNAESIELDYPILYLQRGWATDSGGAGRQRGGLSLLGVYAPHKVESTFQYINLEWKTPDAMGIFGGYPGAQTGHDLVRQSDLRAQFQRGHMPDFDELDGERIEPARRSMNLKLGPADVVRANPPAGAGWGDPLDRPPADVARDLQEKAISPDAGARLYGCVLRADGTIDAAASDAARARVRQTRTAWPRLKTRSIAPSGTLTRVAPLGDRMAVVKDANGEYWTRCECDYVFAPADENWREYASRNRIAAADLGIGLKINDAMEARAYACPGCGRLHAVDICRTESADPHDIRLVFR
ncbi:MAG: hydantoinase B/oxoprolinase family protein [Candidatus Lustribacter sp.]